MNQRTTKSVMTELRSNGYTSSPDDVLTVVEHKGMISSSIDLRLTNHRDNTDCRFAVSNIPDAWKWLKKVNEVPARKVVVERDGVMIPFEESAPYLHRFSTKTH